MPTVPLPGKSWASGTGCAFSPLAAAWEPERINRAMAEVVAHFAPTGRTHHIHATGAYGTELFPECLRELGADITGDPHMDIREYIRDMADVWRRRIW